MPEFSNHSYTFKEGRVFNIGNPFEFDASDLKELIKFLIEELGMSLEEIKVILHRDLGFTVEKASDEINDAIAVLNRENDEPSLTM